MPANIETLIALHNLNNKLKIVEEQTNQDSLQKFGTVFKSCASGIHAFLTHEEAFKYDYT